MIAVWSLNVAYATVAYAFASDIATSTAARRTRGVGCDVSTLASTAMGGSRWGIVAMIANKNPRGRPQNARKHWQARRSVQVSGFLLG